MEWGNKKNINLNAVKLLFRKKKSSGAFFAFQSLFLLRRERKKNGAYI